MYEQRNVLLHFINCPLLIGKAYQYLVLLVVLIFPLLPLLATIAAVATVATVPWRKLVGIKKNQKTKTHSQAKSTKINHAKQEVLYVQYFMFVSVAAMTEGMELDKGPYDLWK